MANRISIQAGPVQAGPVQAGSVQMEGVLNDTATAQMIWDALPIDALANTWGDEIYFGIPVDAELENGQEVVELGDLGYWPLGQAFCIFFGPTPASRGPEIRPASAVTVIGKFQGSAAELKMVGSGARVVIDRLG